VGTGCVSALRRNGRLGVRDTQTSKSRLYAWAIRHFSCGRYSYWTRVQGSECVVASGVVKTVGVAKCTASDMNGGEARDMGGEAEVERGNARMASVETPHSSSTPSSHK
jgi:hypothetical protein